MSLEQEENREKEAAAGYPEPAGASGNSMASASMALGILSLPGICCCGVGGIVLGSLALILGRLSRTGERTERRALAGMLTGAVSIVLGAAAIALLLAANMTGISVRLGGY